MAGTRLRWDVSRPVWDGSRCVERLSNRSGPAIVAAPTTFPSVPSIADVSSVNREAN